MKRLPLFCLFVACAALLTAPHARAGAIDAIRDADSGRYARAQQEADTGVTADVVTWMYLLDGKTQASFSQIASFVGRHPDWPDVDRLYKVAESRLPDDLSAAQVVHWFSANPPVSADGMRRYMRAMLSLRQTGPAVAALKSWWVRADLGPNDQAGMMSDYRPYFSTADHTRRLEHLLTEKQYTAARALAGALGGGYARLVEARYALQEGGAGVDARVGQVPGALLNDAGLMLSRVQYRREQNMDGDAVALLLSAPPAGQTTDPAAWWKERHIMARRMMERGDYRTAYKLASTNGLPAYGSDFAAAEFLAGWLALRHTGQPYEAFEHFEKLFNNAETPITKARAAYWAGRASEALNSRDVAVQWYQQAARYQTTFYGQQAAQRIGLPLTLLKGEAPAVSGAQRSAFESRSLVQAVRLFHRAGMAGYRAKFLKALAASAATPQDFSMASDFAVSLGQIDSALKIAKEAERKTGLILIDYAFPTMTQTVGDYGVDQALVHALIRQESQFDTGAVSSSGALGLMQLMPATAKITAKRNDLRHDVSWLTSNPGHNVRLGSLYIGQMLRKYNGSMPLAIAAYNAGPGRVDQWIAKFGDPRDPKIDMIDWMETIPVYETRNYVQRVLEGYAVYRMKLARYHNVAPRPMRSPLRTAYNP